MINFFESNSCISYRLADYFGEKIENEKCGHCSLCEAGQVLLSTKAELAPITSYNSAEIINSIKMQTDDRISNHNISKLLCGIQTPAFFRMDVKSMKEFGMFEKYSFVEVKSWVSGGL